MIYGTTPLHVDTDETDRIGIRTLVLSKLWQATSARPTQQELDDQTPAIPDVPGGVLLIGQQTRRQGGALRTTWTFEGINGNGKSVTFKGRTNSLDYEFQPGFSERSLLLLPNIQKLMADYSGTPLDGQIVWNPELPNKTAAAGLSGQSQGGGDNPLYGRETYFGVDGTYSFRYASLGKPAQDGVARITGSLPGDPPVFPSRNWLKLPIQYKRRGPVYDCLEQYWLSDEGGWLPQIYSGGASSPNSSRTSGLGTGSLSTGSL